MPLTLLFGVLTLFPIICALAIAALGWAKRALPPVIFGLAAIGVLVPAICLLVLAPYLASGEPLRLTLFGGVTGPTAWFAPVYRADPFSLYAGLGLAFLVAPVLLWLAWQGPTVAEPQTETEDGEIVQALAPTPIGLARATWGSVALALAAETAALTLLFSDNLLWLGLSWVVLAALAWGLGEIGAGDTVDRAGLAFVLAGPVLWSGAMLMGAVPAKAPTLYDLMGRGSYSVIEVIILALTLALAGGAYPFAIWVRRRAILAAPAGVAAAVLTLVPIALYVGARTYSAAQDTSSAWPEIGKAVPPITAGIAFALLGAITVGAAGLLALERRDVRSTLALLAVAQIGWGFLALGAGDPASILGLTVLLATAIFGLGAMVCAAFASGTLGDEEEREGAGPRPFGASVKATNLIAWCVGAVSLIGAPVFGGFVSRQMVTAAALSVGNLTVPLIGLAWAGDGLLAIALLRLTAPAFTAVLARPKAELEIEAEAPAQDDAADEWAGGDVDGAVGDEDDLVIEALEALGDEADAAPVAVAPPNDLRELPGLIFAALALVLGIAPQLLLNFGGMLAAATLAQAGAVDSAAHTLTLGYSAGLGQWLASLAWLALAVLVILFVVFMVLRPDGARVAKPALLAGQSEADVADPAVAPELAGMAEPLDAWRDIEPAFASPLTLPAGEWLLPGAGTVDLDEPDDATAADAGDETAGEPADIIVVEADEVYAAPATATTDDTETDEAEVEPAEVEPVTEPATSDARAEAEREAAGESEETITANEPEASAESAEAATETPTAAEGAAEAAAEEPAEAEAKAASSKPDSQPPDQPAEATKAPAPVAARARANTGSGSHSRSGTRGRNGKSDGKPSRSGSGKKGGR